jgi:hypothetical protein
MPPSGSGRRWSAEETGLQLVESFERAEAAPDPLDCPSCGSRLTEVRTVHETMAVGDGHTYTDVAARRGCCSACGWVTV